ncbi:hypothetical protein BGX27_009348 [Mortierella sp. AM989]|nr:hypothetical protein BGX27_009348 [Mortierella sp. AM989]
MPFTPARYFFCERKRIVDICKNVKGIRIESTEAKLEGYQIYLVEQWAIERNREVATAVSFTGDPAHTTFNGELTGQLFVTNLSLFDSSLNIVLVPPPGDFDLYQRRFYMNLNLRRMGCSGRSALTSKSPSDAQREKFNQLYRISDSPDFEDTVIRLVDLVQNCLFIFGLFKLQDVDGLLCNATEKGLDEFYSTFLSTKFQKFSTENKLDPSVLAGLFSMVSSVRSKLQHLVNNVPKDPIAEPVAFVNAVKAFQLKKPDLKACFLDHKTVEAIMAAYQSSFNPQGLKVHKVLKSKIEDFSGMTTVNPEGETTDLEVFAKNITTESLKQVWRGKPKHKPDMADALASGDWLTGGKELGKSLVRGFGKNLKESKDPKDPKDSKDSKETKQDKHSIKGKSGKNRQSISMSKGKSPFAYMKEGGMTDDTLVISTPIEHYAARSDDERNGGDDSDEALTSTVIAPSTSNFHGSEEEVLNSSTTEVLPQPTSIAVSSSTNNLASLLSQKPEPPGKPEITTFYLDKRNNRSQSRSRKRARSMTGLAGEERLLGCRKEASKNLGGIPGIACGPQKKIIKHPAYRQRSQSCSCLDSKNASVLPLKSLVVECDILNYNSYQLLKEKEESLKSMYDKMQTMEKEFSGQLESLKTILHDREKQFLEIQMEAFNIMKERTELLAEVKEKEHATQISVYNLDGMVGKLVEMRGFAGAFFNRISYLDTKLPVSQRRLALWMDRLQALQSQWLSTIGRYVTAYAPSGVRNRFIEWEKEIQLATTQARELRGSDVEIVHANASANSARTARSARAKVGTGPACGASQDLFSMGTTTAREMSSEGSQLRERRGAIVEPTVMAGAYMVTPQSLKTEGDDAEKDVSELLHLRMSGRGDGFVIKDNEVDFATAHGLTSTPGLESALRDSYFGEPKDWGLEAEKSDNNYISINIMTTDPITVPPAIQIHNEQNHDQEERGRTQTTKVNSINTEEPRSRRSSISAIVDRFRSRSRSHSRSRKESEEKDDDKSRTQVEYLETLREEQAEKGATHNVDSIEIPPVREGRRRSIISALSRSSSRNPSREPSLDRENKEYKYSRRKSSEITGPLADVLKAQLDYMENLREEQARKGITHVDGIKIPPPVNPNAGRRHGAEVKFGLNNNI